MRQTDFSANIPSEEHKRAKGYGFSEDQIKTFNRYTLRAVEAVAKEESLWPHHFIHNIFSLSNPALYQESHRIVTTGFTRTQQRGMAEFYFTPREVSRPHFGFHTISALNAVLDEHGVNETTPEKQRRALVRETYENFLEGRTEEQQILFAKKIKEHRYSTIQVRGMINYHLTSHDVKSPHFGTHSIEAIEAALLEHGVNQSTPKDQRKKIIHSAYENFIADRPAEKQRAYTQRIIDYRYNTIQKLGMKNFYLTPKEVKSSYFGKHTIHAIRTMMVEFGINESTPEDKRKKFIRSVYERCIKGKTEEQQNALTEKIVGYRYSSVQKDGMDLFYLSPREVKSPHFGIHTLDALAIMAIRKGIDESTPEDQFRQLLRHVYGKSIKGKTATEQISLISHTIQQLGVDKTPYIDLLHLIDKRIKGKTNTNTTENDVKMLYAAHAGYYRRMPVHELKQHLVPLYPLPEIQITEATSAIDHTISPAKPLIRRSSSVDSLLNRSTSPVYASIKITLQEEESKEAITIGKRAISPVIKPSRSDSSLAARFLNSSRITPIQI